MLVIVALIACAPTAAALALTTPATIRITDVQQSYRRIDGAHGRPGSVELIDQLLYNAAVTKHSIGRARMVCTYLDDRARNCSATFVLPKGSLVAEGVISSRLFFEVPIVGGTGLYANVRGTLTVTSLGLRPRRELLLFRLVP